MRLPIDTETVAFGVTEPRKYSRGVMEGEGSDFTGRTLLLTVEEAAELLRLGRTTTYELVMRGLIPSVKIGRRRLVVRSGLSDFVSGLTSTDESS